MSLNWKIEDIENMDTVCFETWDRTKQSGQLKATTHQLIYITMIVGMGEITEENWQAFFSRLRMYESLFGPFVYERDEEGNLTSALTEEVIKAHIGLWTNATRYTRHKFLKRVQERWEREQGKLEA